MVPVRIAYVLVLVFVALCCACEALELPHRRARSTHVQAEAAIRHNLTRPHLPRVTAACPCANAALCKPLTTSLPDREVFTFHVADHTAAWEYFDWSLVTTVCVYGRVDPALLCKAHSVGARISVATGWNSQAAISNATARAAWVADRVAHMQAVGADGINMDFENSLVQGSPNVTGLTLAMAELQAAARAVNPLAQITFDAPVRPNYEGRFYNFTGLALSLDFFVLMAYDLNDYSDPPADNDGSMANSPYWVDAMGLVAFQDIGVPVSKLVMALPWYGYDYVCDPAIEPPCVNSSAVLSIFNSEIPFNVLMDVLRANGTDRGWSESAQSPFFNYPYRVTGLDAAALALAGVRVRAGNLITRQIWYDNPYSLMLRFKLAQATGLRGVGMWTGDKLSYGTDDPTTAAMWEAVRDFFPPTADVDQP